MSLQEALCQFAALKFAPSNRRCEDAFSYSFESPYLHYACVFDGCGGLGSKRYQRLADRTGAFLSSQTCAEVFNREMSRVPQGTAIDETFLINLKKNFLSELNKIENSYGEKNRLIGSMVRTLPCTASGFAVTPAGDPMQKLHLDVFQSGDSRVYIMRPKEGLQQLTRDELRGKPDALKNLYVSAPLENMINIDADFTLTHSTYEIPTPAAVLCASDGFFGYFKTPMHFEKYVLDSMMNAANFSELENNLLQALKPLTGDDSTAVMPFYGWTSYEQLKADFAKRHRFISGLCSSVDADPSDETIDTAWNQYKALYYDWQDRDK
ncbi:MAG: protein phosphatase 2C domain-containing protein [Lachnospiraceae bacterium]|nr:protein phosphatase 2C domain-containing protein [Lachnospiraceae bacterium]